MAVLKLAFLNISMISVRLTIPNLFALQKFRLSIYQNTEYKRILADGVTYVDYFQRPGQAHVLIKELAHSSLYMVPALLIMCVAVTEHTLHSTNIFSVTVTIPYWSSSIAYRSDEI